MYDSIKFKIEGVAPLLMHNPELSNPRNEIVKEIKKITAKRTKKTDEDLVRLSELEFKGGLYMGTKGPVVPGETIEGMIRAAARKVRKGVEVQSGVMCCEMPCLIYDGPKTADGLWEEERFIDYRGVRVDRKRVMRTRPRFDSWSLEFNIQFLNDVVSRSSIIDFVHEGGRLCGLCDYKPRFGRFAVVEVDDKPI